MKPESQVTKSAISLPRGSQSVMSNPVSESAALPMQESVSRSAPCSSAAMPSEKREEHPVQAVGPVQCSEQPSQVRDSCPVLSKQPSVECNSKLCPTEKASNQGLTMGATQVAGKTIDPQEYSKFGIANHTLVAPSKDTDRDEIKKPSPTVFEPALSQSQSLPSTRYTIQQESQSAVVQVDPRTAPPKLINEHYDVLLIYCDQDKSNALKFKELLQNFITLDDENSISGCPPSVCVLDRNDNLEWINSKFDHLEEALKRSTYIFLFVTPTFCQDAWAALQKDEVLMESIDNEEKRWCVVPIHTAPKHSKQYVTPFGLRSLKGIDISQMLRKHKTLDTVEVEELKESDIDKYFLSNTKRMLNVRHHLKLEREKEQAKELKKWAVEEEHKLIMKREEELAKERAEQMRREKERELHEVKIQEEMQQVRKKVNQMTETPPPNIAKKLNTMPVMPPEPVDTPEQLSRNLLANQDCMKPQAFLELAVSKFEKWQDDLTPQDLKSMLLCMQEDMAAYRFEQLVKRVSGFLTRKTREELHQALHGPTPSAPTQVINHYHAPQAINITNPTGPTQIQIGNENKQTTSQCSSQVSKPELANDNSNYCIAPYSHPCMSAQRQCSSVIHHCARHASGILSPLFKLTVIVLVYVTKDPTSKGRSISPVSSDRCVLRAVPEIILGGGIFFRPLHPQDTHGVGAPRPPGHVSALINPPYYGSNTP